jgi:UDP-4-amino-4,6-dideoxy-N-acetyl-beta-L-altrosamine N-acetyltransferase
MAASTKTITYQDYQLRYVQETDLEIILEWRNDESIRSFMYTQNKITLEEHKNWFAKAKTSPKRHLLILEKNNQKLGFMNITETKPGGIAEWGFYTAPNAQKGTGTILGNLSLEFAFLKANLHKVCGETIGYNEASKKMHLKLHFNQEGIQREQFFDGEKYNDIYLFGITNQEWKKANNHD